MFSTTECHQIKPKKTTSNAEYHLTLEQINKVISACSQLRNKVILQLMAYTGMRRSEVAGLQIEDILWEEEMICITNGKGHKQRYVPLPALLVIDLKKYISNRNEGSLILSRFDKPISIRQINRIVKSIGESAEIKNPNPNQSNLTCHLFRHTFARLWKQQGGDIESLSRILGHSSVKTTWDLYGTQSIDDVKRNYKETMKNIFIKKRR